MDARNQLKNFSLVYVILAAICLLFIVLNYVMPEVAEERLQAVDQNISLSNLTPTAILTISYIIEAVCFVIYALLVKNFAERKNKGVLLAILLAISILSYIATLYKKFVFSALLGFLVDVYVLQLVLYVKRFDK